MATVKTKDVRVFLEEYCPVYRRGSFNGCKNDCVHYNLEEGCQHPAYPKFVEADARPDESDETQPCGGDPCEVSDDYGCQRCPDYDKDHWRHWSGEDTP